MEFRPSTLWVCLSGLLLAAGCSSETEPSKPASPLPQTNIPAPPPKSTLPSFRLLDEAADQELREAFAGDRDQREAAQQKYASQRWRFQGTVGFKDDLHAVVHPPGMEPVFVYFRSREAAADVQLSEEHLFEATVDDWISRYFQDAIVIPPDRP